MDETELVERHRKETMDDFLKAEETEARRVADFLAQGFNKSVQDAIEAVALSVGNAAVMGTPTDRIAALRCFGQTLVALADREYVFSFNEDKRRQMLELRTGQTRTRAKGFSGSGR